jgi:hypothetical protein
MTVTFANPRRWRAGPFIAAPPNGSPLRLRVVDEVCRAPCAREITADRPAATQFLSPRLFLNAGATAAALACGGSGVFVGTDP